MVKLGKMLAQVTIPARHGHALKMNQGQKIKVIDLEGKQVCDFFAIEAANSATYLSGIYTRSSIGKMRPGVGDMLFNNHREPIMVFEEDTTVGIHDMLFAP